ncbi:heparinase II/III domain-containing protein [Nesterenkonia haasae]|uniref:heparinase II/III domain-containing protein n=1 Tax=Nesterenkonia haasae TaxID=2587813 RepID=UPI0013914060|nr:heparinase II/III family protein [Nesterenkonia haasae]NDK33188.1 hypothetical protein [Nesterenkonia haasae]
MLDDNSIREFDRLLRVRAEVGHDEAREVLIEQLHERLGLPGYVAFLTNGTDFNLTFLRTLHRGLLDLDLPDMAMEVLKEVAERTNAPADHKAFRKAELESSKRHVDRYTPRTRRRKSSSLFSVSREHAEAWIAWLREHDSAQIDEWFYTKGQSAEEVIEAGWIFEEFEALELSPSTDWISAAGTDRTWGFTLHSWEFLDPIMQAFFQERDPAHLEWAVNIAVSWSKQALRKDASGNMMWYDMALALRSPRLAGLLHAAAREGYGAERLIPLFQLARAHFDAHEAAESFVAHNNHGFYAAFGQIVLSRDLRCLPRASWARSQGEARMRLMAEQQFLPDGGHAEHSPDYHRMLLTSFQKAIEQKVINSPQIVERIRRASEALGWFVQPDGTMLQFGDSPARRMVRGKSEALSETTKFILTDGKLGKANEDNLFVMPSTGYAVVRNPQPLREGELAQSSYLAFTAGFHSRAHKHCDDLSLVWTHEGNEILIDGGRFGYGPQLPNDSPLREQGFFYDSAERQYVESVRAHNTVSVDGLNHNRRRAPYGSGLVEAVQRMNAFSVIGEVPHNEWRHRRQLHLDSCQLTLTDRLIFDDDMEHTFGLHFLLNGGFELDWADAGEARLLSRADGLSVLLSWSDQDLVLSAKKGAKSPLEGWRSKVDRKLEPALAITLSGSCESKKEITTNFTVGSQLQ